MAAIGLIAGLAGAAVSLAGASAQAGALDQQAAAERQLGQYEQQIQIQKANEDQALAQRQAQQQDLKTKYVLSDLQAQAAASGGTSTDPTINTLALNITQQGKYDSLGKLWEGEAQAQMDKAQGNIYVYQSDMQAQALEAQAQETQLAGVGGFLGGIGGAFGRFG